MFDWLVPLSFAVILIATLPLRTAFHFGQDEGYELMKGWLVSRGHPLYREIWNDQPPLHTEILASLFRLFGPSVLVGRLLAVGFSTLLVAGLYSVVKSEFGRVAAVAAVFLLVLSSSFVELSASVMLEIPALSVAMLGFSAWRSYALGNGKSRLIIAGILFGLAMQVKVSSILFVFAFLVDFVCYSQAQLSKTDRTLWWPPAIERWVAPVSAFIAFALVTVLFYPSSGLPQALNAHFSESTRLAAQATNYRFRPGTLLNDFFLLGPAALGALSVGTRGRHVAVAPLTLIARSTTCSR
jgi:hypothetical protein